MSLIKSDSSLEQLQFGGQWRRYQQLAFDAFEHDVQAGRRKTHIVAPPGSGKTLLGIELIRRLGKRALLLAPNSAIQVQWPKAVGQFLSQSMDSSDFAAADPNAPIACLTYQSLCQIDDPATAMGRIAELRWTQERASAVGLSVEEVARDTASWTGEAAKRRTRELARITATVKREIARGEHDGIDLAELITPTARERILTLRAGEVGTVVLDECHHLASLWGYVVREVIAALGDVHVIGLTATPPDDLTTEEEELYRELLGDVDFTVPTPAVVRDGYLAPFQELAWLTLPLESERQWLAEHDTRFQELMTELLNDDDSEELSFPVWVVTRMRYRGRESDDGEVSWERFQRRNPSLARAGARFLGSAGLTLPSGIPRGEAYRQPPDIDDWLVLLQDYALHRLAGDPTAAAAARYQAVSSALQELGYQLTRQGVRKAASEVDRLLTSSAAKPIALVEVLGCEVDARADTLRALVLCDSELASARANSQLTGVLDREAGTAIGAVRALAEDIRTAVLRPLLVSGRGLLCVESDAEVLLGALRVAADSLGIELPSLEAQPLDHENNGDLMRLTATGSQWSPRVWVRLATEIFSAGKTQALVGTRALLGEGWDAPCVNCLVDLTTATTGVSVRQMRGRSLRLDPNDPEKIASNWDIVCVVPESPRGAADYRRFVRKHGHLLAPCEDGTIEAGPSHVHPELGPFTPPPSDHFSEVNRAMQARAAAHSLARERWQIGQPYSGVELSTRLVHSRTTKEVKRLVSDRPPRYSIDQRLPLLTAGLFAAGSLTATVLTGDPVALLGLGTATAPVGVAARRLRNVGRQLPVAAPLDLVAHAVVETYLSLGELEQKTAQSLAIEPRASGYLRCYLRNASAEESKRFSAALDSLLGPIEAPRYLVSRMVADPQVGAAQLLGRVFKRKQPFTTVWHAVPEDLGRRKERAEVFAAHWQRWLGPTTLQYTQRSDYGRQALAAAAAQSWSYDLESRDVWL